MQEIFTLVIATKHYAKRTNVMTAHTISEQREIMMIYVFVKIK